MSKAHDREEFMQRMVEEFSPITGMSSAFQYGYALMKLAKVKERYNLLYCNVGLTPGQEANAEKVDTQVKDVAEKLGTTILIGGDPRGYALKIILPSKDYNTWGGVDYGWGIPS